MSKRAITILITTTLVLFIGLPCCNVHWMMNIRSRRQTIFNCSSRHKRITSLFRITIFFFLRITYLLWISGWKGKKFLTLISGQLYKWNNVENEKICIIWCIDSQGNGLHFTNTVIYRNENNRNVVIGLLYFLIICHIRFFLIRRPKRLLKASWSTRNT